MQIPKAASTNNIVEIVEHPVFGTAVISRIPETLRVCLNANAQQRALHSAGCEIRFRLNSPEATIRLRACEVGAEQHGGRLAQVLFGDFSHTYFPLMVAATAEYKLSNPDYSILEKAAHSGRRFHPRLVRLVLPTHASICQVEIDGEIAPHEPGDLPDRRVLIYGSSITQGAGALSVRESWAGQCAHHLGMDLINLGFGGGCHCEPEMTDYLCQRNDFDVAILETGINMLGLEPDITDQRIEALIRNFSSAHPDKPVFCVGVFPCRNDVETGYAGRAEQIRALVRKVVADIGAPHLHFIEGREALTHATGMTTDLTHPSPSGMLEIGRFLAEKMQKRFQPSPRRCPE